MSIQTTSRHTITVGELRRFLEGRPDEETFGFAVSVDVGLTSGVLNIGARWEQNETLDVTEPDEEGENVPEVIFEEFPYTGPVEKLAFEEGDLAYFDYENPGEGPITRCGYFIRYSEDGESGLFYDLSVGNYRNFRFEDMMEVVFLVSTTPEDNDV